MAGPDNLELQAPDGTYQFLSSITGRIKFGGLILGNTYTARFIRITPIPDGSSPLHVHVKAKHARRIDNHVSFCVDPFDQITDFKAERQNWGAYPSVTEPFGPPTLAQVLGVIKKAQKIEPTLKPR